MEEKSTREAYGETLARLGKNERIVVLDADLSCSTKTCLFAKKFPDRFFNFGITEQNMVAAAAGFALSGKIPFVSTFAVFATAKALEQIRYTIAYSKLNVKIVATHAGITVGEDGASHHAIEDIALMRPIPNMNITVPADAVETRKVIENCIKIDGPFYIRLGRPPVPVIFDDDYDYKFGKAYILKEGNDVSIIATGFEVNESLKAARKLEKQGVSVELIDMHTIKPIDKNTIVKSAKKTGKIITCEEHSIIGGLGSAVAEVLVENNLTLRMKRIGIRDCFAESGNYVELVRKYGLDSDSIVECVKEVIK